MAAEHDRPDLTQAQREALLDLLHEAFVYLRSPGYGYFWVSQEDWNKLEKVQAAVDWSVAIAPLEDDCVQGISHDQHT